MPEKRAARVLIRALEAQLVFDEYTHVDYSTGGAVCKWLSCSRIILALSWAQVRHGLSLTDHHSASYHLGLRLQII